MTTTYRILSIPRTLECGADHPWTREFGHDGTVPCLTCGAHLKRVCIVDGEAYGLDCAGTVFGLDTKSVKAASRKQAVARKAIEDHIASRFGGPYRHAGMQAANPARFSRINARRLATTLSRIKKASAPVAFRAWTDEGAEYQGEGPGPLSLCDAADLRAKAAEVYPID